MDTMETTKIVGGVCGALLIFLLVGWAGETIYHVGHTGHGDEEHISGYPIEVEEEETEVAGDGPTIEELLAAADVDKGKKVFSKCKACHKLEDGANGTGPHLFNVMDRDIASIDGFEYSGVLNELPGDWTVGEMDAFLKKPSAYAKGTKMTFPGLKKPADRANLIGYLQSLSN